MLFIPTSTTLQEVEELVEAWFGNSWPRGCSHMMMGMRLFCLRILQQAASLLNNLIKWHPLTGYKYIGHEKLLSSAHIKYLYCIEAAGWKHLERVLALEFSAYELGLYKHNLMYLAIDYFKISFNQNCCCFLSSYILVP